MYQVPDPGAIEAKRRRSENMLPSLIISIMGVVGIVALYFLTSGGLNIIDIEMLLVVVGFCILGYSRGINRGLMTFIILYVATGVAATLYRPLTPYVMFIPQAWRFLKLAFIATVIDKQLAVPGTDTIFSEQVTNTHLAFSLVLFMLLPWIVLEIISRVLIPDTRRPELGILDNLGGVFVYLVIGVLVASFLFNAIGYGHQRNAHNAALLRPTLNQVLKLDYTTHKFWFRRPPSIYIYDL